MILLKDILSQNRAVRYLKSSLANKKIANAYLFIGPEGVGKSLAVKAFIAGIMCPEKERMELDEACGSCRTCSLVDRVTHPDLLWIKPDKNKFIKIEEIRNLKLALSVKPYEANVNAAVIEEAAMMKNEAANSLLKILEEPPGRSMIILISTNRQMMLPTVISRCLEVHFNNISVENVREVLTVKRGLNGDEASVIARMSGGSLGKAINMAEGGLLSKKKEVLSFLADIIEESRAGYLVWPREDKDALIEDIELIIMFLRDVCMLKTGFNEKILDPGIIKSSAGEFFKDYSLGKLSSVMKKLINLKWALAGNSNPKLVAQVIPELVR